MSFGGASAVFVSSLRGPALTSAERTLLKVMGTLKQQKTHVYLVCSPYSAMHEPARSLGVEVALYRLSAPNLVRTRSRLRKYLRRQDPIVVHSIGAFADVLVRLAAARLTVPAVSTIVCDDWLGRRRRRGATPLARLAERLTLRLADQVLIDCVELEGKVLPAGDRRLLLEPPSVDLARVTREAETAAPLPVHSRPQVGYAGTLRPGRGLEVFANAARLLVAQGRSADFIVAGKGEAPPSLSGSPVRVLGPVERLSSVLARLDVCCFPLTAAGMPTAFLEAAALGKPIVTTAVPGVGEMLADGEEVVLVPPDDPGALAEAIGSLLDDPDRARAMGSAARHKVLDHYSSTASVDRHLALYKRLSAGRVH